MVHPSAKPSRARSLRLKPNIISNKPTGWAGLASNHGKKAIWKMGRNQRKKKAKQLRQEVYVSKQS